MTRAERRRRTANVVRRRLEFVALIWVDGVRPQEEAYVRRYVGRCKVMHPYDCGRPRCGVCGKRFGRGPTKREMLNELAYEEQLRDV